MSATIPRYREIVVGNTIESCKENRGFICPKNLSTDRYMTLNKRLQELYRFKQQNNGNYNNIINFLSAQEANPITAEELFNEFEYTGKYWFLRNF